MGISRKRQISSLRITIIALLSSVTVALARECTSSLDNQLIIADAHKIWKLNANGEQRQALLSSPATINLDYDYDSNSIYFSDTQKRQIFALKDDLKSTQLAVAPQKKWLPFGFALEQISGKLYAADSFSGTVRVFDLHSDNQGVVIGANLTDVKDVEVDAYEGYLFVLDKYQILRTDLDGLNPEVIYSEYGNIDDLLDQVPGTLQLIIPSVNSRFRGSDRKFRKELAISDLVLDTQAQRLYWVDSQKRCIESSDYYGKNKQVHFQDKNKSIGVDNSRASLAYLNGSVFWADDITEKVIKVNLNNENKSQIILKNIRPRAIKAVSCKSQRQVANPCVSKPCDQLCLLSRNSKDNFRCTCNVGYELAQDKKSCIALQDFLLFTQNKYIRGQSLNSDGKTPVDVINPSRFKVGSSAILDANARDGVIYHNSLYPNNQLYQLQLANGVESILEPDLLSKDVRNLAFDWTTGNLYYLTYYYADVTTLSVLNVNNPTYSKILIDSVRRLIRDLVVHPNRGYIYIAQLVDNRGSISRLATDGSELKELIELGDGVMLEGMAVDYDEDRIYWSESSLSKSNSGLISRIRHSNLNGTNIQEIPLPSNLSRAGDLAVHGESLYVLSESGVTLHHLNKRTGEGVIIVDAKDILSLSSLRVFNHTEQRIRPDHPCIDNKCQKFCFAVPTANDDDGLKAICGCPYGEKLSEDGRSCVDNSQAEPPFKPCKYQSFKCNMSKVQL